jgi:hypothetical protein
MTANLLPVLAAGGIEFFAWWLAGRRIRGVVSGGRTLRYVLCEVALGYGVLGTWSSADGYWKWGVVVAALVGAAAGWEMSGWETGCKQTGGCKCSRSGEST